MTLESYVQTHFRDEIWNAAERLLKISNCEGLDVHITFLEVYNIDCTAINEAFKTPTLPIILQVQTTAEDEGEAWLHEHYFSGEMTGDFSDGLAGFRISLNRVSKRPYGPRHERYAKRTATTPQMLVQKLDMNATADNIRARFSNTLRFQPIEAIRSLGIKVITGTLDDNILGAYVPRGAHLPDGQIAKESTILIDKTRHGRFTATHEFVHAYVHRYVFWLQVLCGGGEVAYLTAQKSTDVIEYQANKIATYLLMPERAFRQQYEKACKKSGFSPEVVQCAISEVAYIFGASICAVRRRCIELGYLEAKGVYEYIDGGYVPAYAWEKVAPKKGETYSISQKQYENLIATEPSLKEMIESGAYIYIEKHVVKSEYVVEIGGALHLRDDARGALDKCAILFQLEHGKRAKYTVLSCGALREKVTFAQSQVILNKNKPLKEKAADCSKRNEDILSLITTLSVPFPIALKNTVKWTEMRQRDIAYDAEISESTLSRYLNGTGGQPPKEVIIRLCYAMQLPYEVSLILLERAGYTLQLTPQDSAYRMLLMHPDLMPLEDWNALFLQMGENSLCN